MPVSRFSTPDRQARPTSHAAHNKPSSRHAASSTATFTDEPATPPARTLLAAYFLLALAWFAVGFFPDRQLVGTDYIAAGHFFSEFISGRFAAGAIPKWTPYVFGGLPVYANPGGTYYPAHILASLVLPPERALVAVFVIQFTIAGIGTYLFLRALALSAWTAALGGLAYEFTGITLSYVYAGHDGRIIAATMLPVVLLCVSRALESGQPLWFLALAAAVANLLLSFQIQSAYYVLLAAAAWGLFVLWRCHGSVDVRVLARRTGLSVLAVALSFGIAAVNFLPFASYVAESPRADLSVRGYDYATSFSMPPQETIGLAIPEWQGILDGYHGLSPFKYHTEYVGAFVLVLLLVGIRKTWRDPRWRFFLGLGVFALVMAWGGYTPAYHAYYRILPGVSKFRAPSIGFFLVSFSLVVMASLALDFLVTHRTPRRVARVPYLPLVLVVGGLGALIAVGQTPVEQGVARFGLFAAAISVILWCWWRGMGNPRLLLGALGVLVFADLSIIGRRFLETVDPPSILLQPDDVVRFLLDQHPQRVWVFPAPAGTGSGYLGNGTYGVSTDFLMHFKLRQMGGEHGNQLQRWNDYVGGSARKMVDWSNLTLRAGLIDAASVDYIVSTVELETVKGTENATTGNLKQVFSNDRVLIYHNGRAMPRAYFTPVVHLVASRAQAHDGVLAELWHAQDSTFVEVPQGVAFPALERGPVTGDAVIDPSDNPDRVVVRTTSDRDAMLVLTEAYADGWQVSIDGRSTVIYPANYAFRGVNVPKGKHVVTFEFKPPAVYAGIRISLVSLALLLGLTGAAVARERQSVRRGELQS